MLDTVPLAAGNGHVVLGVDRGVAENVDLVNRRRREISPGKRERIGGRADVAVERIQRNAVRGHVERVDRIGAQRSIN